MWILDPTLRTSKATLLMDLIWKIRYWVSIVDADGLVLKLQGISILNADQHEITHPGISGY